MLERKHNMTSSLSSTTVMINKLRIFEKNKIYTEIKTLEKSISRNKDTITRLNQDTTIFNLNQVDQLSIQISNFDDKIISLNTKITEISSGLMDESFIKSKNDSKSNIQNKNNEKEYRKGRI